MAFKKGPLDHVLGIAGRRGRGAGNRDGRETPQYAIAWKLWDSALDVV